MSQHQDPNANKKIPRGAFIGNGGRLFVRVKRNRNFEAYIEDSRNNNNNDFSNHQPKPENDDGSGNNTNANYMSQQEREIHNQALRGNNNTKSSSTSEFSMPQKDLQPILDFMEAQNGYHKSILAPGTNDDKTNNNNNGLNFQQNQNGHVVFRMVNNNNVNSNNSNHQNNNHHQNNDDNQQPLENNQQRQHQATAAGPTTFQCTAVATSQRGDVVLDFVASSSKNHHQNNNKANKKSVHFSTSQRHNNNNVKRQRQDMESGQEGERYFEDGDLSSGNEAEDDEDKDDDDQNQQKIDDHDPDQLRSKPIKENKNPTLNPKSILNKKKKQGISAASDLNNNTDDDFILYEAVSLIPSSSRSAKPQVAAGFRRVEEIPDEHDGNENNIAKKDSSSNTKNLFKKKTFISRDEAYGDLSGMHQFSLDPSSSFPSVFEEIRPELQYELECIDEMLFDPNFDETIGRREQEVFRGLRSGASYVNNNNNQAGCYAGYGRYAGIMSGRGELVMDDDVENVDDERKMKTTNHGEMISKDRSKFRNDIVDKINRDYQNIANADDDHDSNAERDDDYGDDSDDNDDPDFIEERDNDDDDLDNDENRRQVVADCGDGEDPPLNEMDDSGSDSTIENEHDDIGGFTGCHDDDDEVPRSDDREMRSMMRQQRRNMMDKMNPTSSASHQSFDNTSRNRNASYQQSRTAYSHLATTTSSTHQRGTRVGEDGAVREDGNYQEPEDEFALDGLEDFGDDFDPFKEDDNDPHIFFDSEGNAYVGSY